MPAWLQILLAILALLILAPLAAWIGKRARGLKGNLALGAILLGIGEPIDPPPPPKVESADPGKDVRAPGEPPLSN
jgi:hypothetical protein